MAGLFGKKKAISSTENRIGALRIQNSSQGLPVAIVIGKTRVVSNLLWYGDFTAIPHTDTQKKGGKGGGGPTTTSTTYTYTTAVIFGLCEGPVSSSSFLGTVWSNKKVTDATTLGLSQFQGDYSQSPWTYLTTNHANEARNYRGDCYVAASAFDLGSSDGLPNLSYEVSGLLGASDQNPADIIPLLLSDDKFGAGWPSAQTGDLSDFGAYCAAAGFFVSPAYVAQQPMSQMLADLVQVGNAGVIWSDGLLKIVPYADTAVGAYTPDLTIRYYLGYSDFIASPGTDPVKVDRKRQSDAYNCVRIECLDRANQYNTALVEAKDQLAIDLYGLKPMGQISAHAICDPAIARTVAQAILQRELYVRNVYTFTVGWRYGRLEPMDIVALTDAAQNLNQQAVRIIEIAEDESGQLEIKAEELNIGNSSPSNYSTQTGNGATPANNNPPGNAVAPVMFQPPIALSGKPQVWIGTAGGPDWGGAQVWASHDDTTFEQVGVVQGPARLGVLTANFPSAADPDTTHNLSVDLSTSNGTLTSSSNAVADTLGTLSIVCNANGIGELVAYSAANLTAPNNYDLTTYIRRAQSGSVAGNHVVGDHFMRLDEAIGAFDVAASLFGTTNFVKLLSYNTTGNALQDLSDVASYPFAVLPQVVASGSGYPFYVDRTSTVANDPGSGKMRFNNASQASATEIYFDDVTATGANIAAYFSSLPQTGFLDLRDQADTNKWATFSVAAANAAAFAKFTVAYRAGGAEMPNGDTVVATFSPSLPTGVNSVALNMPASVFAVANSPITSNGTFGVTFVAQNAALFFAGPTSGNAAAPTFRAMNVTADIPPGANTQVLMTQNGVAAWANATATFANQSAATVFAGPATGNAAAPAFRALEGSDLPPLTINAQTANYTLALSDGNGVWLEVNSANAVIVTVPSQANVAFTGNFVLPIERYGNGALTIAAQANVTVHNSSSNTARAVHSVLGLKRHAADEWTLFGDTT